MTNVQSIEVEPVLSVAIMVGVVVPTSPAPGVPDNVRLAVFSVSQAGAPLSVYWKVLPLGLNVVEENVKVYGSPTRATGGT